MIIFRPLLSFVVLFFCLSAVSASTSKDRDGKAAHSTESRKKEVEKTTNGRSARSGASLKPRAAVKEHLYMEDMNLVGDTLMTPEEEKEMGISSQELRSSVESNEKNHSQAKNPKNETEGKDNTRTHIYWEDGNLVGDILMTPEEEIEMGIRRESKGKQALEPGLMHKKNKAECKALLKKFRAERRAHKEKRLASRKTMNKSERQAEYRANKRIVKKMRNDLNKKRSNIPGCAASRKQSERARTSNSKEDTR